MLAKAGPLPLDPAAYVFEMKWDGYRAIACRMDGRFMLSSRSGIDLLPVFPELARMGRAMDDETMIDGEIVALDAAGLSGFSALQTRMPGVGGGKASSRRWDPQRWRICFMAFDLLHHRGEALLELPWNERRARLDRLDFDGEQWATPAYHADGRTLLATVGRMGGEGIIAKRRDSIYRPGWRTGDWIKIKLTKRQEFIVGGYWTGGRDPTLGSLLLGYYRGARDARQGRLSYAGRVGAGFDEAERLALRAELDGLHAPASPFSTPVEEIGVSWCRPQMVVEIGYAEWTHGGILRHARYKGQRGDKSADEVIYTDVPDAEPGMDSR